MTVVVYGIPTCGTVQKARRWLEDAGIAHTFVDFRTCPPERPQVEGWVRAFGARAMRNTSGASYRALPDEKSAWTDDEWTRRFAQDPMLIKRPIVEQDGIPLAVGFRDPASLQAALRSA